MDQIKHVKRKWKPPEEGGDNKEEPTRGRRFGFLSDLLENSWHSNKEEQENTGEKCRNHKGTSSVQLQAASRVHEAEHQEKDLNLQEEDVERRFNFLLN